MQNMGVRRFVDIISTSSAIMRRPSVVAIGVSPKPGLFFRCQLKLSERYNNILGHGNVTARPRCIQVADKNNFWCSFVSVPQPKLRFVHSCSPSIQALFTRRHKHSLSTVSLLHRTSFCDPRVLPVLPHRYQRQYSTTGSYHWCKTSGVSDFSAFSCADPRVSSQLSSSTSAHMEELCAEEILATLRIRAKNANTEWICANDIRRALRNNHFVDVLEMHTEYISSSDTAERTGPIASAADRATLLGERFRTIVLERTRRVLKASGFNVIVTVPTEQEEHQVTAATRVNRKARSGCHHVQTHMTLMAMREGAHAIVNGVLVSDALRIVAHVPLLLRRDVAERVVFPHATLPSFHGVKGHPCKTYVPVCIRRSSISAEYDGRMRGLSCARARAYMWIWSLLLKENQPEQYEYEAEEKSEQSRSKVNGGRSQFLPYALLIGLDKKRDVAMETGYLDGIRHAAQPSLIVQDIWAAGYCTWGEDDIDAAEIRKMALNALLWRAHLADSGNRWLQEALLSARFRAYKDSSVLQRRQIPEEHESALALAMSTSLPQLRPNMKVQSMFDWPYSKVKMQIAKVLGELTLVSGVSRAVASRATQLGMNNYMHPDMCAERLQFDTENEELHVKGLLTPRMLQMCKVDYEGPTAMPDIIPDNIMNWRGLACASSSSLPSDGDGSALMPLLEEASFYIDLELASPDDMLLPLSHNDEVMESKSFAMRGKTGSSFKPSPCSLLSIAEETQHVGPHTGAPKTTPCIAKPLPQSLYSTANFSSSKPLPQRGVHSLIFLIGVGTYVKGKWQYNSFIADNLCEQGEADVINRFSQYVKEQTPQGCESQIYVWGHEQQLLQKALDRSAARNGEGEHVKIPGHVVNLNKVVSKAGLVVKGMLSSSLKAFIQALEKNGLVEKISGAERELNGDVTNGEEAKCIALEAAELCARTGGNTKLFEAPMMGKLIKYNEADCRDVQRILYYLRDNH